MADQSAGKVFLVGAGPGDPGLITLRAVECLRAADLVLYDGLVNPLLLSLTRGTCERTARIRSGDAAVVPQQDINARLIAEAHAGRTVVRLKGGDPYIFGRGSEEAAALHDAGIPFEVVPGITAATAAAEYAGFSLTHRQIASAVAFITGHEDPQKQTGALDYPALAAFPGTLVFYMGLGRLPDICRQLVACGKPPSTPAAVVCHACWPTQQVVSGTLESLPALAAAAGLRPPSLIVVGDCVTQRPHLSWFEQLPLFGVSIGITRPADQCPAIAAQIVRQGGEPVVMPLLEIRPLEASAAEEARRQLQRLAEYQWLIFTSVNGVEEFVRLLWEAGMDLRAVGQARIAAIGTSTAAALAENRLRADLVPTEFRAEALADALIPHVANSRCLWLRASRGRDVLPERLRQAGAVVDELVVYQNLDVPQLDAAVLRRITDGSLHWIGLSSPSMARRLAELLQASHVPPEQIPTRIATISPLTSAAARETGLQVAAEATDFTWEGILAAIHRAGATDPGQFAASRARQT